MRVLLSLLAIFTIAVLFGSGAFVTQGPETAHGLVVLTDTDMSLNVGGPLPGKWVQKRIEGSGNNAVCNDVDNCPQGKVVYNYPETRCEPCRRKDSGDCAYSKPDTDENDEYVDVLQESWCDNYYYEGERCMFKFVKKGRRADCTISVGVCR